MGNKIIINRTDQAQLHHKLQAAHYSSFSTMEKINHQLQDSPSASHPSHNFCEFLKSSCLKGAHPSRSRCCESAPALTDVISPQVLFSRAQASAQGAFRAFCQHCSKEEKLLKPPHMPSWLMTSPRNRFTPDCGSFEDEAAPSSKMGIFCFSVEKAREDGSNSLNCRFNFSCHIFPIPSAQADTAGPGSL